MTIIVNTSVWHNNLLKTLYEPQGVSILNFQFFTITYIHDSCHDVIMQNGYVVC